MWAFFLSFLSVQLIIMLHSAMCLSATDNHNARTQQFSVLRMEFFLNILYIFLTFSRLFLCFSATTAYYLTLFYCWQRLLAKRKENFVRDTQSLSDTESVMSDVRSRGSSGSRVSVNPHVAIATHNYQGMSTCCYSRHMDMSWLG